MSPLNQMMVFSHARAITALRIVLPVSMVFFELFWCFPQLDFYPSALFYTAQQGFWLADNAWLNWIYQAVDVVSRLSLLLSLLVFIYFLARKQVRAWGAAVVLVCLIAGPLLAVNAGVKEYWGRARPREVQQFGGVKSYTAPGIISHECAHNCAFSSGHAAAGFALCIGYFVSRRKIWLYGGMLAGGLIGFARIVNGAHFLSDVLFSFLIVWGVSAFATLLMVTIATRWIRFSQHQRIKT